MPKDQPDEGTVSHSSVNQPQEEILEYWTEQRMAEAKPRELTLPAAAPRHRKESAETEESGPADQPGNQ